jgi:hypothetical protein
MRASDRGLPSLRLLFRLSRHRFEYPCLAAARKAQKRKAQQRVRRAVAPLTPPRPRNSSAQERGIAHRAVPPARPRALGEPGSEKVAEACSSSGAPRCVLTPAATAASGDGGLSSSAPPRGGRRSSPPHATLARRRRFAPLPPQRMAAPRPFSSPASRCVAASAQRKVKLIATDVDGTLLNSQQLLAPEVEAAVNAAAAAGVPVRGATADTALPARRPAASPGSPGSQRARRPFPDQHATILCRRSCWWPPARRAAPGPRTCSPSCRACRASSSR